MCLVVISTNVKAEAISIILAMRSRTTMLIAGDDDRGMMLLEWGGKPEYITWDQQPRFRNVTLTQLIENPDYYLNSNTFIRVTVDVDISYEESTFLKENFMDTYKLREISFIPGKKEDHATEWEGGDIHFEMCRYNCAEPINSN